MSERREYISREALIAVFNKTAEGVEPECVTRP